MSRTWPKPPKKVFNPTEKESYRTSDLEGMSEHLFSAHWGEDVIIMGQNQVRFIRTKISGVSHLAKNTPGLKRGQIIKDFLAIQEEPIGWTISGKKKQDHLLYLLKEEPERIAEREVDLRLEHEPDNLVDENAICIHLLGVNAPGRAVDIGYLPKNLAASVDLEKEEGIVFHYEAARNKRNLILWMAFFLKNMLPSGSEIVEMSRDKPLFKKKPFKTMSLSKIRKKYRVKQ